MIIECLLSRCTWLILYETVQLIMMIALESGSCCKLSECIRLRRISAIAWFGLTSKPILILLLEALLIHFLLKLFPLILILLWQLGQSSLFLYLLGVLYS